IAVRARPHRRIAPILRLRFGPIVPIAPVRGVLARIDAQRRVAPGRERRPARVAVLKAVLVRPARVRVEELGPVLEVGPLRMVRIPMSGGIRKGAALRQPAVKKRRHAGPPLAAAYRATPASRPRSAGSAGTDTARDSSRCR